MNRMFVYILSHGASIDFIDLSQKHKLQSVYIQNLHSSLVNLLEMSMLIDVIACGVKEMNKSDNMAGYKMDIICVRSFFINTVVSKHSKRCTFQ